jgi:hypothetical protein
MLARGAGNGNAEQSKVSTPKCNSYPSLTARKATVNTVSEPKLDKTCFLFQHKVSKVTNGS